MLDFDVLETIEVTSEETSGTSFGCGEDDYWY